MLKISTGVISCFSGESYTIDVDSESSNVWVSSSSGVAGITEDPQEFTVSLSSICSYRGAVDEILSKPECLRGDRSTTVYQATVCSNGTDVSVKSSEIPNEQLIEIVEDPRTNPELKEKIEASLASGYHNWAHELFRLTKKFVESCANESRA